MRDMKPIAKDLDEDGLGEYCFLLELCGISYLQTPGGKGRAPTTGAADWRWFLANDPQGKKMYWKNDPAKPDYYWAEQDGYSFLVHNANMDVIHLIDAGGIAERKGYLFALYLPGETKAINAGAEVPPGNPDLADARERRFCAYAWPKEPGVTGRRAFFTDRFEAVWSTWNIRAQYGGRERIPKPEAAFHRDGPDPENLDARPGIAFDDSPTLDETGLPSCDGEVWKIYGERKGIKRKFEKKWTRAEEIADFKKDGGTRQPWWGEEE
jgi:hypothetical protein